MKRPGERCSERWRQRGHFIEWFCRRFVGLGMKLLNLSRDLVNSIRRKICFFGFMNSVIFVRQCFVTGKETERETRLWLYTRKTYISKYFFITHHFTYDITLHTLQPITTFSKQHNSQSNQIFLHTNITQLTIQSNPLIY